MANSSHGVNKSGAASDLKSGHIGVVTVTYNSAHVLQDFFDSLASQTCTDFTLYVVDNASSDDTLARCRTRNGLPIALLANDANLGVAEGNNQGIRAALADGCEYVLLLNNDTTFDPGLLTHLRDGLVRHKCSMVTPKILFHDQPTVIWAAGGRFQPWLGYRAVHYGEGDRDAGQFDKVRRITYAPTCCVLIERRVFDRIGLMDERYFVYYDDTDFMYRAMRAKLTMVYLPSCSVRHKIGSLTGGAQSVFANRYGTRNRVYFIRKHLSKFWAAMWVGFYCIHVLLRYLFRRDPKAIWIARRHAIAEGICMGRVASSLNELRGNSLSGVQR